MATKLPEGVNFPANDKGERSTSDVGKQIFAATFRALGEEKNAEEVLAEKNWRFRYTKYVMKHVESSLKNPSAALTSAQAGLDWMQNNFDFVRDGKTLKFAEAMKTIKGSFSTGFIQGSKPKPSNFELVVPYKGKELRGTDLIQQVNKWSEYGTIEPSAAEAITMVARNPKWVDLSNRYFVILGAGSAMGPYSLLLSLGANIIAIDLDRP